MNVRIDRNHHWELALARVTSAFLVGMTLSGLSLWVLPFSVTNQILVIVHTLAGVVLFLPVSYYLLTHWLAYRRHQMTHLKLAGYVGLFVLALCNLSGLVLTFHALVGPRISYAWDTIHIVTTFAILAFVAPHILAIVIRDRKARLAGMGAHGRSVAVATAAARAQRPVLESRGPCAGPRKPPRGEPPLSNRRRHELSRGSISRRARCLPGEKQR